ncbi:hypothetical protein [Alicyclobacillus fodiniaquatilis]|jgi:hypothetical protein|uniref:Uncharacterized protein n=1 Tax=Alicyclobacillus fodiniaquatilis TaxID=1661150 RepID=A0ABW4JIX4_9BACL
MPKYVKVPSHVLSRIRKQHRAQLVSNAEHVTDLILDLAKEQLQQGLEASNGHETKATGIIAFEAVLIALILDKAFGWWVLIPASFMAVTMLFSICALWGKGYDSGPNIEKFYETHWADSNLDANLWMARGLQEAVLSNAARVQRKGFFVNIALIGMILTALSSGAIYFTVGSGDGHGTKSVSSKQSTSIKTATTGNGTK